MIATTWTEIPRRLGAYEVGDYDNSVYVRTLPEALAVAAAWHPENWHPALRADMSLASANASLAAAGGEGVPQISRVEEE